MRGKLSTRIRMAGVGVAMAATLTATGCGFSAQSIPLPGGVDVGDHPRTYKITFSNILDLVPQSMVKLDGSNVGQVTKIEVPSGGWDAVVTVRVKDSVDLSDKSIAAIQQTNLLGEKFVSFTDPGSVSDPRQPSDEAIPKDRTKTTTDFEQLLGALSMLLNGGGINQLEPIVTSLNESLGSQPSTVKNLIKSAETLIGNLNGQRDAIVSAIDGVAKLSERAAGQTDQIERILDELPAGIQVLEEQRPQFVELLTKLDQLGDVGTSILGKAHQEIINDLKALRPILSELSKSADDLITAAPLMLTHPFPDSLLPAVHGDSTNLFLTVDLRVLNSLEALGVGQGTPKYQAPSVRPPNVDKNNPYINGNGPRWGWPTISLLPPSSNSRPGPNTPPSGGTYSSGKTQQKKSTSKKTQQKSTTRKPVAAENSNQYTVMPLSNSNFFADAVSMIGVEE